MTTCIDSAATACYAVSSPDEASGDCSPDLLQLDNIADDARDMNVGTDSGGGGAIANRGER